MSYVGTAPLSGDYRKLDDISSGFDGSETAFTLQVGSANVTPPKETTVTISVGGILQEPVAAYTIDGSTITFTAAPATGANFFGVLLGDAMSVGTPADDTVTGAKIVDDAINSEHYAAGSIDNEHIADGTIALAKTALVAGTGITFTTDTLSVDASQTQITSVGTIATGTWEGTTVAVAQGGTGATTLDNLITLATHTTGDYVQNLTAGTGLTSTGATSGENIAHSLSVDASQTQITSVGALDAGSISTNFGAIDNGASAITTTGLVSAGSLTVSGTTTLNGNLILGDAATDTLTLSATIQGATPLVFEGADSGGANDHETSFAITDPTADRTITFPDASLTVNAAANISGTTLASNVVTSSLTAVGTIATGVWQGTAIASTYIAGDAITGTKIADDAIDSEHYVDGSIDTAHIADDQITLAKMASGTAGNIIAYDASGNPAVVATGTDGQVLTSAGAGAPPAFEDAAGGVADDSVGVAQLSATGTADGSSFLRGDNVWASVGKYFILTAPTISSPANAAPNTDVVYTITSTDSNDDKLILDFGASTFNYQSVSVGTASKVGNTVECIGFTTNNPVVTVQFTAEAIYSVTAKATNLAGSYGDSVPSSADSITISSFDPLNPYDYGDGTDGSVSSVTVVDTYLSNSPSAGSATCTVNSTTGFAAGDQVLLIQNQKSSGLTSGTHEFLEIASIASTTVTFTTNLQNTYSSGSSNNYAQIVRVPEYSAVSLGSDFAVPAWNGQQGGIFVAKCSGTFALSAKINATSKGFRGATSTNTGSGAPTRQGEGQTSTGSLSGSSNQSGGGGGRMNMPGTLSAQSGAGGGHAAAGTNGSSNATGGVLWGGQDLTAHLGFGGGGGAGGYDYSSQGGHGGAGGGIIIIIAATLTLSGSGELEADGGGGTGNSRNNQGGGAGGSIYVKSGTFTTNNACNAAAGPSGTSSGGAGSVGRIHVQASTITGTTSPTAYTG